ncbi:beta-propeller fold lactonase family protein [Ectobacillus sp. JY-23]|uniref:beta-propeller fold lactonase family protein n=1 Tax=Ectobacillus sp. JY-23 TaxID=2933872 RepID=UPI001FF56622|nr:beta-propeller fold lactonase family protein [Ectobacillus sp. JY-23]UOY91946.1 beta-propeller fold lactonase family protein [Ectobacillus sp. JY-23]
MKQFSLLLLTLLLAGAFAGCSIQTSKEQYIRNTAINSDNIMLSKDENYIYTANMDTNTVTIVNTKTKKTEKEIKVGKEPRQLTLSPDEAYLYVSCMQSDRVDVIDLHKRKVVKKLKTGIEPFGLLTSQDGKLLYVANFRSGTLSVIDIEKEKERKSIKIGDRPRTLAMTADGEKLYVPHYLDGIISVVDTKRNQVQKEIKLAPSPDKEDRKKSQGIPNTLEQFVIAPDGKTAWVPHLLTNTDTPIHFEETIFPSISIIDLEKDEEIVAERKELFEEMNVKDSKNATIIVSNPYDVVFDAKGTKAFAVMSGSEDLVVFDLTRGGNASQVVRRIPGDNPRGIVLSNKKKELFVHNAMSHNVVVLQAPQQGSYAKVKLTDITMNLIASDPLSALVRKGKRIFYSANTDEYAAPITGNNWMSCASCHSDGDINSLTLSTAKGLRNVPSNVLTTKTGLFMWDGSRDDFTDYIHTVQGEMGGMMNVDPGQPMPADVQHMYDALLAYLDDPSSFPVPKSPYRENGKLTKTAERGEALFNGKGNCLSCHGGEYFTASVNAVDEVGKLTTANMQFLYDIGTASSTDQDSKGDARAAFTNARSRSQFDPPTLRGVWATAPYLHDGSAKSIEEAIERHQYQERADLTQQEIQMIASYVKSLE